MRDCWDELREPCGDSPEPGDEADFRSNVTDHFGSPEVPRWYPEIGRFRGEPTDRQASYEQQHKDLRRRQASLTAVMRRCVGTIGELWASGATSTRRGVARRHVTPRGLHNSPCAAALRAVCGTTRRTLGIMRTRPTTLPTCTAWASSPHGSPLGPRRYAGGAVLVPWGPPR